MKTFLKKIYILSITLIMTISIMPISNFNCFAESEWDKTDPHCWEIIENGISYTTNPTAKEQTVYAQNTEATAKDVIIPESINGLPVTSVSIEDNDTIQTLKIPSSVNWIRILNCPDMIEFDVDKNNETFCSVNGVIYDKNCRVLICYPPSKEDKTFRIPDSVESIGYAEYNRTVPFNSCKYLENVIFPESLKGICECAFTKCNFEYIEFPEGVSCGPYAFGDNKNLKEVVIPENFNGFSDNTFEGCDLLKTAVSLRKEPFKDQYSPVSSWDPWSLGLDCVAYIFMFETIDHITIYVPDDTVENYEYALGDVEQYNFVPLSKKPKGEIGDVNSNGKIEVLDAVNLQRYLSNKRSSIGLELDINEDNIVDVFDLIALKRMMIDSNS